IIDSAVIDRFGNSKVDYLRNRLGILFGYQNIRRLDVAVDDALLVGVMHCLADRGEQVHALANAQLVEVAVLGDWNTRDILHHEVRPSLFAGAGVKDSCDMRVIHYCQRLALRIEARHYFCRAHSQLDDLQRCLPADGVLLLGQVDSSHATLSKHSDDPVSPELCFQTSFWRVGIGCGFQSAGLRYYGQTEQTLWTLALDGV